MKKWGIVGLVLATFWLAAEENVMIVIDAKTTEKKDSGISEKNIEKKKCGYKSEREDT